MDSTMDYLEKDLEFFKTAAGETVFSQLAVIPEAHEKPNFSTITTAERLFKALFMYFDKILAQDSLASVTNDPQYKDSWELYKRLESTLYPWMYPYWQNAFHINNQTFNNDGSNSKGIVLCVGNAQFKFAASTIRSLREVLNCDLPIEIFYIRDDDLSAAKRSYLESEFSNVTLRKLEDYVGNYYTRFGGWAMKPFAMLASRFTELIMMDADVFFLQSPSTLFVDKGYQTTGSLFFYDRTLFPDWEKGPDWMRSFLPTMSTLVPNTRWFKGLSSHEQESGVVVIDKRKSLLGLLSTCKMNGITERDEVVYKHVHGDKETFWVGFEVMQTPYAFVKSFGAVIGGMGRGGDDGEPDQVCGVQLHLDPHDKPLWFNGGVYRNKHARPVEYLNFTHFSEGNDWEFNTHCIRDTDKIRELDPEQRKIALASVEIDKQRVNDEKLLDEGKWRPKNYDSHH
ncbi:MAG: mannosyltransferase putative-domain-containing protein [Benjaminiella poitrasii]|nr:MAG: mannosyltransferase putative-domain-containing protein [Benjaminiella poitrasii]